MLPANRIIFRIKPISWYRYSMETQFLLESMIRILTELLGKELAENIIKPAT